MFAKQDSYICCIDFKNVDQIKTNKKPEKKRMQRSTALRAAPAELVTALTPLMTFSVFPQTTLPFTQTSPPPCQPRTAAVLPAAPLVFSSRFN